MRMAGEEWGREMAGFSAGEPVLKQAALAIDFVLDVFARLVGQQDVGPAVGGIGGVGGVG